MRFEGTRWLLAAPHLFGEDSADVLDRFLEVLVGIAVVLRSNHVVPARPGRAEKMGVLGIDCIGADHVRLPVLPQSLEVAVHAVVVRGRDEIELTVEGVDDVIAEIDRFFCTAPVHAPDVHLHALGANRRLAGLAAQGAPDARRVLAGLDVAEESVHETTI